MRNRVFAAVVCGLLLVLGAGISASTGATPRTGDFSADLLPLNKDTTGTVDLHQTGTNLEVHVVVDGLDDGIHLAHIHGMRQAEAECPTLSADANMDGFVDFAEGLPDYGPVQLTLSQGETGTMLDYVRNFRHLDSGDGIASLGPLDQYAIVIHGVDLDGDGVADDPDVDGNGAGDPPGNEISMPALCGVIR
jgi:Cu/Zn superoxide dismutase